MDASPVGLGAMLLQSKKEEAPLPVSILHQQKVGRHRITLSLKKIVTNENSMGSGQMATLFVEHKVFGCN